MEPLVSRTVTGYAEVPPTYVSKPELCMTHTQTLPAMNTAQSSQAFTQTFTSVQPLSILCTTQSKRCEEQRACERGAGRGRKV